MSGASWLRAFAVMAALAALVSGARPAAAAIEVRASVDRNQAAIGEPIVLSIEVNGAQNAPAPAIDNLDGFQAQYLGPATQVSFVNGQMSSSVTHRYRLLPQRAGRFTVGPFELEIGGQKYSTARFSVDVSAAPPAKAGQGGPPGKEELQLVLSIPKSELYVGERVPLEVVLYVGNARVDELQFPAIAGEGVVVDKLSQPARRDQVSGGRRYQTLHFTTQLSAVRPGTVQLSATMGMNMLVSRRRGGDQFFDQFFSNAFSERRPVEVRAEPRTLDILPLPDAGRPADFTGAVGRFDFDVTAQPNDLAAGDPVTVRMTISGEGDLSRVEAPPIAVDESFRKYDAQLAKGEEGGARKVFEQVLIPKREGAIEIPAIRFGFFDAEKKAYATIVRGPFPLTVRAAIAPEEPKIVAQSAPAAGRAPEQLGRDIVYIKAMPGSFRARAPAFHRSGWFLALQLVPPLGFAGLLAFVRRRERFAADPRLVRFRRAGRDARRLLAELEQDGAGDGFYDRLTGAVHGYLVAKLGLPPGAVERQRVLERLGGGGASADLRRSVGDLFDLLEQARYAPSVSRGEQHGAALHLARDVVERLERQRGASNWVAGAVLLGFACVGAGAGAEQPAVEERLRADPHAAFFQGNAAYQEGRYADAASAYEQALGAGVESGELYFNLGNSYFKLDRVGEAILGYERARQSLPRDPDVRANLNYARERAEDEVEAAPFWTRIAFPLAERATSGELAAVTSLLWLLLWAAAAAGVALPRRPAPANRVLWTVLALVLVAGANLGRRVQQLELTPRSVVVAAGETPVRFEPSMSGTEHFRVREGALLEVTDTRDGWYQVRRSDGRRGWIAAESLELVNAHAAG